MIRADTVCGQVGGGWSLEMESCLGIVKWHRADRGVRAIASPPPPPTPPPSPPPHPELIRNQQQTVRCIKGRSGTKFWNNTLGINAHVRHNLNVHSAVSIKNLCPLILKVILHLFFHCTVSDRYRKKIEIRFFLEINANSYQARHNFLG